MNELKKQRMKSVLKYTWPFYLIFGFVVFLAMGIIFRIAHPIPKYKTLNLFVTGEVTNYEKLRDDMFAKFEDKKIRTFSCTHSYANDVNYSTKLKTAGYSNADVLIMPFSKIENVSDPSSFAISLSDELINSYFSGFSFYEKNENKFGVKVDKEKVSEYMTLPNEDCFMFLNGSSKNLGDYTLIKPVSEHDMALQVVRDWGM